MPARNLKPIRIKGVPYPSRKAAAQALNIPYGLFKHRLRKGIPLDKPVRYHAPWGSSKVG
jgi:hypothetical protein